MFNTRLITGLCLTALVLAGCAGGTTLAPTDTLIPASPTPSGFVITVPAGSPPTLDGTMLADEWSDTHRELFSDGSELLMKYHEGNLYLGIRASIPGMIVGNIFVSQEPRVSILHSSAALGTAIYEKSTDGFQQIQDFVWRCRSSSNSPSAQAERDAFLKQEGWLANNSYMGTPQELEYRIAMPGESLRLAVTFTPVTEVSVRIYWPISLADDCTKALQGEFPKNIQFSPSTWATVTVGK